MTTKFCWACSKKLRGNYREELNVDGYSRTLHKICAKNIKLEFDFIKREDGYHSVMWTAWEEITTDPEAKTEFDQ